MNSSYRKAAEQLRDERRTALDNGRIIWDNAIKTNDALYAAFCEYQEQMINAAKLLPNTLDAAREKLNAQISAAGLDPEVLSPKPRCAVCGDSGSVNGRYCKCVIKRALSADAINYTLPQVSFEKARKTAPSEKIAEAYDILKKNLKPDCKPFVIILGTPGCGKTTLAAAYSKSLADVGNSVIAISAFEFFTRAKSYQTALSSYTPAIDRFTPLIDCDVLTLDDIGTEPMDKNITKEYFYNLINERWLRKKHTVITSTLTPTKIMAMYGEAAASRLFDKSIALGISITETNNRIKPTPQK